MESSTATLLPMGIATKDSSNHEGLQHMGFADPANTTAVLDRAAADQMVGIGTHTGQDMNIGTASSGPIPNGNVQPNIGEGAHGDAPPSTKQASRLEDSPSHFAMLDTPARPMVDHGIESSVRDTVGIHGTEPGLFKTESAPKDQVADLNMYAALPAADEVPLDRDLPTDLIMAEPSTPLNAQLPLAASPTIAADEPSLHQAYAMLKFPDSYYYVKSTNVMVGRDQHYYRAWRESRRQSKKKAKMQRRAQQSLDDYAREPSHHSQYGGDDDEDDLVGRPAHGLLSTYSDVGGAVSYVDPTDYGLETSSALAQRGRRSKNNSSSNHSIAPRSLHEFEHGDELEGDLYHDREGNPHDPHEWAQVAIHPREPSHIEKISREHLIIRYDSQKRSWVMDVIGNRVLHNGVLHNRGETDIDLNHDDEIIIISVSFRFMLPTDDEPELMESVEYDDDEDDLQTSPAARRKSRTMEGIDTSDDEDSSEEDVPLAQQNKPKKTKGKKGKTKEPKARPVKLKLKNKGAGKKLPDGTEATNASEEPAKVKGKAPAKTSGKAPAAASKTTPKEDAAQDSVDEKDEAESSKLKQEAIGAPSTETPLAGPNQAPATSQPPQASPPAAINLDANSAFAGADPSQLPQKRKGPGRPPKNGLISKRDDAGVKRKLKEYERQGLVPPSMNELLEIVRAEQRQKDAAAKAASRGEAAPEMGVQNVDPRMQSYSTTYPSATPSQPQQATASGNGGPNDLAVARSTSPRPRRPARSPSPMPAQETFTEEQLKKPSITYVFIIDEILQDPALDGQADLQTIYDKIQKRWPYFRYGTTTNGWQSSVRHNLLQSPRFVESGKSGKGKYWKIDFSHELDPKKRKQATPPPPALPRNGAAYQQPYSGSYQPGSNTYHSPYNGGPNAVSGPSVSGQMQQNGQPGSGQYAQPQYGQHNGSRQSSQHPPPPSQQPQPFATIVQAILAYQPQFLAPHVGKETHAQASEQFQQALNHYSELHAGNTPPTEGKIDETNDPFKTLKQIFIQYGQGDTRTSQNGTTNGDSTAAATSSAPTSNTNSNAGAAPAPVAVQSAVDNSLNTEVTASPANGAASHSVSTVNGAPMPQNTPTAVPHQSAATGSAPLPNQHTAQQSQQVTAPIATSSATIATNTAQPTPPTPGNVPHNTSAPPAAVLQQTRPPGPVNGHSGTPQFVARPPQSAALPKPSTSAATGPPPPNQTTGLLAVSTLPPSQTQPLATRTAAVLSTVEAQQTAALPGPGNTATTATVSQPNSSGFAQPSSLVPSAQLSKEGQPVTPAVTPSTAPWSTAQPVNATNSVATAKVEHERLNSPLAMQSDGTNVSSLGHSSAERPASAGIKRSAEGHEETHEAKRQKSSQELTGTMSAPQRDA